MKERVRCAVMNGDTRVDICAVGHGLYYEIWAVRVGAGWQCRQVRVVCFEWQMLAQREWHA